MDGRWKLLDIGPERLANENATRKTVKSLRNGNVLVVKNHCSMIFLEVVRKIVS